MGQVELSGGDAEATVDRLVTSDIAGLDVGRARYGLLCGEDGGVIDDVIVYRLGPERFFIVVNASNRVVDFEWISKHSGSTEVVDRSDELEMMAVQGPNAVALVDAAAGGGVVDLDRFASRRIELFGATALVGRTGYTGEDGVELFIDGAGGSDVWTGLLARAEADGVAAVAAGLSARDSLRFEPGYPLYGHELNTDITPLEARLSWAVDLDGADFVGREALVRQKEAGITRRLETIVMEDKGVPREGSAVLDPEGNELGTVVSGVYAPTADVFAANVFLPRSHGAVGTELIVEVRGRHRPARVAKRPLYRNT